MPPTATVWAPIYGVGADHRGGRIGNKSKALPPALLRHGPAGTAGPFILGELRRRFENGEIDGLSQILWKAQARQQLSQGPARCAPAAPAPGRAVRPTSPTRGRARGKTRSFQGDDGVSSCLRTATGCPAKLRRWRGSSRGLSQNERKSEKEGGWGQDTGAGSTSRACRPTQRTVAEHFGKAILLGWRAQDQII